MADVMTPEQRSENMRRIRNKDTKPEVSLRSALHRRGFRFRKNAANLPGRPDIVLPKYKTVIFVNGCYWHRHPGCPKATTPKSNADFWQKKFRQNVERDARKSLELEEMSWKVLTVWECEISTDIDAVVSGIREIIHRP